MPQSFLQGAGPVAAELLPDGTTLVVASAGFPSASFAMADAFTSDCAPDQAFGSHGVERLTLGGQAFSIDAAIPAPGGGTLLAGGTAKEALVARIDASGKLDPSFGSGGWTVLPWPGSVFAIAETPSGDIVLGVTAGGGADTREWVGELTADGGIVGEFGSGGRTPIPVTRDDSAITQVWAGPDGDIYALTAGGNMGCWGVSISALTSSGSPVPSFQSNFTTAMRRVSPSGIFVGGVVVQPAGFLLIGTEQSPCVGAPSPTAQGRVAAFQPNGALEPSFAANGEASFNSPMARSAWVLPRTNGGFVLAADLNTQVRPNAKPELSFYGFSADGSIDRAFGNHGVAVVQLPYPGGSFPAAFVPITLATNGKVSALVTSNATGRALRLIQLSY